MKDMWFYPFGFTCNTYGYNIKGNACYGPRPCGTNGNLVRVDGGAPRSEHFLCWTEDGAAQSERRANSLASPSQSSVGATNRLQAFIERGEEGGIAAYYNYSADGERNFKYTSPRLNIQQNASLFSNPPLVYPTLYASSLIMLTKHGYTKHYFEEGRRICSKIGGGLHGNVSAEEINKHVPVLEYNYEELSLHQREGIQHTFHTCIGADPQIIEGINLHRMLVVRETQRDEEEPAFFYHEDHLGSAAYLTLHGQVYQTLNYLPYGEDWVEYNFFHPADTIRLGVYRFNGKEKDYESGFHYYGARYYWDETLTGWLSVDPLTDDFPYISCYNYCEQNPVKLKDLDGEGPVLGAVVGFIVEYGCQVAENWASGKHGVDMFVPNDGVMLAAATLEGAVTCGVSAGKTVARKAAFTAARSVYVGAKEGSIAAGVNNAIVETVGNVVGGGAPKAKPKVVKAVKKNNSQAYKEAKATGPMYNARAKQVKAANEAQNKRSVAAAQSQNKKNINTANNKNAARSTAATGVVQGTARSAQKAAQKKSNQ